MARSESLSELAARGRSRKASASLIAAEPNAAVLSVTERISPGRTVTRTLRLTGRWSLTPQNELSFVFDKGQERKGRLGFGANWRVNDRSEIEITAGGDKVTLQGYWDISSAHRLNYSLGRDGDGTLSFRGSFGTRSVLAKKGELRYQLGVEGLTRPATRRRRRGSREITLFGKWLVSRDLGLLFEIEYANGRRRAIRFGADFALKDRTSVSAKLTARDGRPLGVELIVTREVAGGEAFIRLLRRFDESRVEAGFSAVF